MAQPSAAGQRNIIIPPKIEEQFVICDVTDFSSGCWMPDVSARNLPDNGFVNADGVVQVMGGLYTRGGGSGVDVGGTAATTDKVLDIYVYVTGVNSQLIFQFTKNKIYRLDAGPVWTEITPNAIAANSGSDTDYFYFASVNSRIFFTNGVDPIREIDNTANQYKAVGNAPVYKYITAAFDRIIGFNLVDLIGGNEPTQIGWSGANNLTEWDPTVDISAGSSSLSTTTTDGTDDGTGIFNFSTYLILTRQQSTWAAQHQNSATSPFIFNPILSNLGADTPRTIQMTEKELIWYNYKYGKCYIWAPFISEPLEVTQNVRFKVKDSFSLSGTSEVFAAYDPSSSIYSLFSVNGVNLTTEYKFNLLTKTWCTSRAAPGNVTWATSVGNRYTVQDRLLGGKTGVVIQDYLLPATKDHPNTGASSNLNLLHKLYELPLVDCNFVSAEVYLSILNNVISNITLNVYRNGVLFASKLYVTSASDQNKLRSIQIKKSIKARNIQLELTTNGGISFEVVRLTILGTKSGKSRTGVP